MSALQYAHPQATHIAPLGDVRVAYLLVRSSRRSIGLEIGDQGLIVRVPMRTSIDHIESVLQDKAPWVLSKLDARETRSQHQLQIVWQHGACLPYLGKVLQLCLEPQAPRGGALQEQDEHTLRLHLPLPLTAPAATVRALTQAWWLRQARTLFMQRLVQFAPALGVQWSSLRLTNARTRWGSATTDGRIMLNWRLLHFRPDVLDYVVIHELSHLRVMNHSPQFWSVVQSVCPDYVGLRAELRKYPAPEWSI